MTTVAGVAVGQVTGLGLLSGRLGLAGLLLPVGHQGLHLAGPEVCTVGKKLFLAPYKQPPI